MTRLLVPSLIALVAIPTTARSQERLPDSRLEYHPEQSVVLQETTSASGRAFGWACRDGEPVLLLFLDRYSVREAPFAATFEFRYTGGDVPRGGMRREQQVTWVPWRGSPPVPGLREEPASPSEAVRLRREGKPLVVEVDRWEDGAWYRVDGEEASAFVEALAPAAAPEVLALRMEDAVGDPLILRASFRGTDPALDVLPCVAERGSR